MPGMLGAVGILNGSPRKARSGSKNQRNKHSQKPCEHFPKSSSELRGMGTWWSSRGFPVPHTPGIKWIHSIFLLFKPIDKTWGKSSDCVGYSQEWDERNYTSLTLFEIGNSYEKKLLKPELDKPPPFPMELQSSQAPSLTPQFPEAVALNSDFVHLCKDFHLVFLPLTFM
jgi:hypothetical protein